MAKLYPQIIKLKYHSLNPHISFIVILLPSFELMSKDIYENSTSPSIENEKKITITIIYIYKYFMYITAINKQEKRTSHDFD